MFTAQKLVSAFGIEITGIDLAKQADDLQLFDAIVDQLHQHRFVVIRDQSLEMAELSAFGHKWGAPIVHALTKAKANSGRLPHGFPEVLPIGNVGEQAKSERFRYAAVFWHTDQAYEEKPASATMLYCRKAPKTGGETLLADMVAAYDALPDETKQQIDGLTVLHSYGAASGKDGEHNAYGDLSEEEKKLFPVVKHPLVLRHPFNGRKTLYAVAGTAFGIEGMEEGPAQALLQELKYHVLQPRFTHAHKYRVGDIAIWDTFATMHSATRIPPATSEEDSRLLWRISCRGEPVTIAKRRAAA